MTIFNKKRATCAVMAAAIAPALVLPTSAFGVDNDPVTHEGSMVYVTNDSFNSGVAEFNYVVEQPHHQLLAGDWNGDGKDSLAWRQYSTVFFKNDLATGPADLLTTIGASHDTYVSGNFGGDANTDIAVRAKGANTFMINDQINAPGGGNVTRILTYGKAADELFIGDWDGDSIDTFAVRRGNTFFIKNSVNSGVADITIDYGKAGDEIFVGDWDGDGIDTLAVRRGNQFYIKDSITSGYADRVISYGRAKDTLLVGDWNGDGKDSFIVRRPVTVETKDSYGDPVGYPGDPEDVEIIDSETPVEEPTKPAVPVSKRRAMLEAYNGPVNVTLMYDYWTFTVHPDGQAVTLGFLHYTKFDRNTNYADKVNWLPEWYETDYENPANWPKDLFG